MRINSGCNTREVVLKRDGTNVVYDNDCAATSGTWVSPYDGKTWTAASDLDIDHIVPLSNAWKVGFLNFNHSILQRHPLCSSANSKHQSGASDWTDDDREAFANDLTHPQLLAVTDSVNSAKSDKGPEEWKPPLGMRTLSEERVELN